MRRGILVLNLVLSALAAVAFGGAVDGAVPVVRRPDEAARLAAPPAADEAVFLSDLMKAEKGVLFEGASAEPLPPGRYRLHAPLALAPLGDLAVSGIAVRVTVAESGRDFNCLHFVEADRFTDAVVDFAVARADTVPVRIEWSFQDPKSRQARLKAIRPPDAPPEVGDDLLAEASADLELEADEGKTTLAAARLRPVRLVGRLPWVEPLPPVEVVAVSTDRIVYRPGQAGAATATVRNAGAEPARVTLRFELAFGLEPAVPLATTTVELAAGARHTWEAGFTTDGRYWGAEARAVAETADGTDSATAVFAVAANPWEVAAIAAQAPDLGLGYKDAAVAARRVAEWREQGFTSFECFFWAPCDFGDFTPDTEDFFSGQTQYSHSVSGTRNLVAAAHAHGMAATFYSNLWGTDGAAGFELMRRHPEWIASAWFNTEILDLWPAMTAGNIPAPHQWYSTVLVNDEVHSMAAIRHHAAEIVASQRSFGWDAIRYDSYNSSEWTRRATERTRELVGRELPAFQFGYNTFPKGDANLDALGVMLGGGGMAMVEYIRMESFPILANYARELSECRDLAWAHGGHLGPLYHPPAIPDTPATTATALDAVYASSIILAAGGHPYYSPLESAIGRHPLHALRYSEFFWNNRMRPLADPAAVVQFADPLGERLLRWPMLARKAHLGGDRRRLILHLINLAPDYAFFRNQACLTPPVIRELPVTLALPPDAKVTAAWTLCPIPEPHHLPLEARAADGRIGLTIRDLRFWQTVVVDYTSKDDLR